MSATIAPDRPTLSVCTQISAPDKRLNTSDVRRTGECRILAAESIFPSGRRAFSQAGTLACTMRSAVRYKR